MTEDEIVERYFAGVPFPKPETHTVKLKDYWSWLSNDVGCMVCKMRPASIHHCIGGSIADAGITRAMSRKNNDWLVIPLCYKHHQGAEGLHQIGVRTWENRFGSQVSFVIVLQRGISFDLLAKAGLSHVAIG